MKNLLNLFVITAIVINSNYAYACAVAFGKSAKDASMVSYNMDWFWMGGGLFTRKSGEERRSLTWNKGMKWTSKYKSLTLSTMTADQPFSGVNEKGLTVHCLGTPQEIVDGRKGLPALNELETINYILDTAKDVSEAKAQLAKIKVNPIGFPLHYFICDKKECIVVDFKDKMNIHKLEKGKMLLTNSYYDEALEMANIGAYKDGDPRFVKIISQIYQNPEEVREALENNQQNGLIKTMWNSTVKHLPDGSSELTISVDPTSEKAINIKFGLKEIFAQNFDDMDRWISFEDMLKNKAVWKEFTKKDAEKLIKYNIKKILSNEYVLYKNKDPKKAISNVRHLEEILLAKHAGSGGDCLEIMREFIN